MVNISTNNVAIVMCIWNRPERLRKTLEMLSMQKNKDFILCLWNNNNNLNTFVDNMCTEFSEDLIIKIKHSYNNIGGIGRFYFAREIMNEYDKILFIDDDQDFNDEMVNYFLNQYDFDAVKSRWSFIFGNKYTSRERIFDYNINVKYCGTGGMILPSKIFGFDKIFEIPEKYKYIEDLWLSYVVTHYLKMKLQSIGDSDKFIWQIPDGKDQSTPQKILYKNEFLNYLRTIGNWKI